MQYQVMSEYQRAIFSASLRLSDGRTKDVSNEDRLTFTVTGGAGVAALGSGSNRRLLVPASPASNKGVVTVEVKLDTFTASLQTQVGFTTHTHQV